MSALLPIIIICATVLLAIRILQDEPITFIIHKKIEDVTPGPDIQGLTEEEEKILEDQQNMTDGLNEVIKFTQDFLGGNENAESKPNSK